MNIMFDTNILLDVFLQRNPHLKHSAFLVDLAEKGALSGWLCATTVTTLYYSLHKELNKKEAEKVMKSLFQVFDVSAVNRTVLETAFKISFRDYEDAVLHQAAFHSNLDGIVTRNKKDFKKSSLPVYSPDELISILEQS